MKKPSLVDQLRGATKLAVDATRAVTEIVQKMHVTIGGGPELLGKPLEEITRLISAPTYGTIRGVTRLVGAGLEVALGQLEPILERPGTEQGAVLAALNGVMGDYLALTNNPLAIHMELRSEGVALSKPLPRGTKLLMLVHGSAMDDLQWRRKGHDHGAALADELGLRAVYLRYNTGLHVSQNGREFAQLLEKYAREVDELYLLCFSMGGLVARSACHVAEDEGHRWRKKLRALITLGTPHHGSPLERGGNWVDVLLELSRYSAPLAKLARVRSAGLTDLRYGNVLDEHWRGRDRFSKAGDPRGELRLPDVPCFAVAGRIGPKLGDGLVPVDSALGRHADRPLEIPERNCLVVNGAAHLDLLNSKRVYKKLVDWLTSSRAADQTDTSNTP